MIGSAVQRGSWVYVYDEKGRQIFTKPAGSPANPKDGLKGYTSNTVNIQTGNWIRIYDEKGHEVRAIPA